MRSELDEVPTVGFASPDEVTPGVVRIGGQVCGGEEFTPEGLIVGGELSAPRKRLVVGGRIECQERLASGRSLR